MIRIWTDFRVAGFLQNGRAVQVGECWSRVGFYGTVLF